MEEYRKLIYRMLSKMDAIDALFIKQIYTIISQYEKKKTRREGR